MTVVVTGASGLLGREIYKQFSLSFQDVIGLGFSRAEKLLKCNLLDFESTNKLIRDINPTVIIHAAAEKRPDVAAKNPEQAKMLNVFATQNLAKIAYSLNALFIYISTDYVFDGSCPPYEINDQPNPLNEYGKAKYEGEIQTSNAHPGSIILRIPVIYGKCEQRNESAVNILVDAVLSAGQSKQDDYHIRYPTCTEDVARVLVDLTRKCLKDKSIFGIFQFSSEEKLTKYQMCLEMASALGKDVGHIIPDSSPPKEPTATRPKDAHLSTKRLRDLGIDVSWIPLNAWVKTNIECI